MDKRAYESPAERSGGGEDGTRREALKRFGRYAAAAPTAMLLLDPRRAHAANSGRRNGNGKGKGK